MVATVASYSSSAITTGSGTINAPSGLTNGDLLILAWVGDNNGATITLAGSTLTALGWTQLGTSLSSTTVDAQKSEYWYKVAASEPASWAVSIASTGDATLQMLRITGQGGTPINASTVMQDGSGQTGTSISLNNSGVTTTVDSCLLVFFGAPDYTASGSVTVSPPAGYTSIASSGTGAWTALGSGYKQQTTAGATGVQNGSATIPSGTGLSQTALIAIAPAVASGPSITSQPTQQTANSGSSATFTVSGSASAGSLSYQWQSAPATYGLSNAPGAWADITGATSASYTTGTLSSADNGTWFRVVVTDANGSITSATARLFMLGLPISGTGAMEFGTGWMMGFRKNRQFQSDQLVRKRLYPGDLDSTEATVWGDFLLPPASGPATVTGTGAATSVACVSSASGSVSVSGSSAVSANVQASAASGGPVSAGSASDTQGAQASAASAGVVVSGAASVSSAIQTSSANASAIASGAGAATLGLNASAASGGVIVSGSAAVIAKAEQSSGTGADVVTGSGATVAGANASSGSGSVGSSNISGAGSSTQAAQLSAATASVLVAGSGASTLNVVASSGTAQALSSGSASISAAKGLTSATGLTSIAGAGSTVQAVQINSAAGSVVASGSASCVQLGESSAGAGSVVSSAIGSAAITQARNISAASGDAVYQPITGVGAVAQASQIQAAGGHVDVLGVGLCGGAVNQSASNADLIVGGVGLSLGMPCLSDASEPIERDPLPGELLLTVMKQHNAMLGRVGKRIDSDREGLRAALRDRGFIR